MLNTSNRSSSTAALLTKFLPTMDKLEELRAKYGEDSFGKQYNALPGTLMAGFSAMGVADFSVSAGEKMDAERMVAVAEEHSAELPARTVIREVSSGLQLEGNVIRMAECVVSLGPESNGDEQAAPAETTEEDAAEA
jgi:molecular chaperone GrpE (heat shock protein)